MNYQFLELFRLPECVWGVPIDPRPFNQLKRDYERCFNLCGRTANLFLVTSDDTIRREDAIAFAQRLAAGQVVRRRIDFQEWNNCNPKRMKK